MLLEQSNNEEKKTIACSRQLLVRANEWLVVAAETESNRRHQELLLERGSENGALGNDSYKFNAYMLSYFIMLVNNFG